MPIDQPPVVEAVVVTAPRLPPSPAEAAFSVVRLDRAELGAQPRLDEALKQVPGVSLFRRTSSQAANPTTQGLSLRSFAPSGAGRALVTLDGVPQNDPFGGWVIWSALPPESIEAASVVRGAGAGPYGAGALTGVVALEELSAPGTAAGDASAGELETWRGAGAAVLSAGGGGLFLAASAQDSAGWIPVREGRGRADQPLSLSSWSLAGRLQAPLAAGVLAARLSVFEEDRGSGLAGGGSDARGSSASLTYAAQPSSARVGYRLQLWSRSSDLESRFVAVAPDRASTTPANTQYATPATGWGANAAVRGLSGAFTWEAGADLRAADGETRERFRNLGAGFTRGRIAGGQTLVGGGYGELTWAEGPWLLTGGARLDGWATLDGHRTERDLATGAVTFEAQPEDRSGLVPTARAGLRHELGGGLHARAAAYAGFRPPTLNELYRPFRVGNDITEANAALDPERLYGAEAGLGGRRDGFAWSATAFLNRLEDPVTNVTVGFGPGVFPDFPAAGFIPPGGVLRQRRNAGAINAAGLEADAEQAIGETLTLRAAFAYTVAEVDGGETAPQLTGLRPAQAPRLTATAGAAWRPLKRLRLQADLRYETARFEDDLNTRVLGAAWRADARAEWSLTPAAALYLAADNVFDAAIETGETAEGVVSYDAPRVVRVGLALRR
ncbi:MAG TPA: TonB-dependent receptor [Caulobacteraceae bacterium]|jgi:outer membrane receptor protein involved in Fe transport